jgi:hypothetical protein
MGTEVRAARQDVGKNVLASARAPLVRSKLERRFAMGEVIRRTGAVNDIIDDTRETYRRATARQGKWKELADERLAPVLAIIDNVGAQRKQAEEEAAPLIAALDAEDDRADRTIGKVSDDIWNAVGRPASDPALNILFPGGNSFYVDGDVNEQPDKMDLLIFLLQAGVHPKLSKATAETAVSELVPATAALRDVVNAARGPRTKVLLFERIFAAVARSAAIELANYKRLLKGHGFSEADIHAVIPDRGSSSPKKP